VESDPVNLTPIDIASLLVIGALVAIITHQLALARVDPTYRYGAAWTGWSAAIVAAFWIHHFATTDREVVLASRTLYTVMMAGLPVGLLLAQRVHGAAPPQRRWFAIAVAAVFVVPVLHAIFPEHLISIGWLRFATIGAPGALIVIPAIPVVAQIVRLLRRSPRRTLRIRVARGMVIAFVLASANDLLVLIADLHSVFLFPIVAGAQAIVLHLLLVVESTAMFRDLEDTVAKRTEEITTQRAELRTLMNGLPDGVIAVTGDRIVFANPAAARLTGTPSDQLVGASLSERLPAADRARIRAMIDEAVASGEPRGPLELRLRPSPDALELEVVALGVQLAGQPTGLVILHDVSERSRMREQLLRSDRLASLGTLVAGTGHEINNPLTSMMGNLELLLEQAAEAPIDRVELGVVLQEVYDGCVRIRTIVRDMREFARPDVGDVGEVDLADVVGDALKLLRHSLEHQVRLVCELAPAPTLGSRARFGQVVVNLLTNALQASRPGSTTEIRVVTRVVGAEARLEVHDTGIGMSRAVQQRAFDPFFTTKPVGTGTGLGLSICHGIATAYGGRLELDSVEHQGTTVTLVLPVNAAATNAVAPPVEPPAASPPAQVRRARVLVIDDDEQVLRTISRILQAHDVETATNLAEIEARLRQPFDVVLCDLMMPETSGMDLHARLTRDAPDTAAKMLFMTGGAFTPDAIAFVEQMGPRCLLKPLTSAQLREAVAAAIA